MKYLRGKQIVEAEQFVGEIPRLLKDENDETILTLRLRVSPERRGGYTSMVMETVEQDVMVILGDWVVHVGDGRFRVETDDDFRSKYIEYQGRGDVGAPVSS